jgi:SAM-dependent methyltransferase
VEASTADWPGADRRDPPRGTPTWSVRRPLADWLQAEARAAAERHGRYRVLDVGSGIKPYYPYFAAHADAFVGVDLANPDADVQAPAEDLPVEDGSYEVVLCNQVLEHVDDPDAVVRELHRVTAPGGRVLASTHGVMVYHPNPDDLWRWTHSGLERLFRRNGDWSSVTVSPGAGTGACLGMLLATYLHLLAKQAHAARLAEGPISLVNAAAAALDRRVALLRGTAPGTIAANYHVVAVR